MIDLFEELKLITRALEQEGIEYAIVGGLAYSALVKARATEDIDLLIYPQDWERIKALLGPFGYEDLAGPMDFKSIRMRRLVKLGEGDLLMIDFLFADNSETAMGIERRIHSEGKTSSYYVAPPQVIILLKEQRMSDIDKMDIVGLRKLIEGQET